MPDHRTIATLMTALALVFASTAEARVQTELHIAARNNDVPTLARLLAGGGDPNGTASYDTTPLYLAAKLQHPEAVALLLANDADPNIAESFFNTTPLQVSLWDGAPEYAVTKLLLAAGARDRVAVLDHALGSDDLALARTAARSGSFTESEATDLRARYSSATDGFARVLAELRTVADPPRPDYSVDELVAFGGRFESRDGDAIATIGLGDAEVGSLTLTLAGASSGTVTLVPSAPRVFRSRETSSQGVPVKLSYFGRAGTIEGIVIEHHAREPLRLRVADTDEPVETFNAHRADSTDAPVVAAARTAATVNWPGFRGANRAGVGDGRPTPVEIDLAGGRSVAWRAALPGLGNSSPVVWGDVVYITTAVAAGEQTPLRTGLTGAGDEIDERSEHRWLVLAYDKRSGAKLWETEVGRAVPLTKRHFKATQANSTAATDGEHVVVAFPTAGLACLGAKDGALHWKHELGGLNAGGFNDPGMQWGFAASPVIFKDRVVLQVDIHDGGYLAAWELGSGRPLWRTPRPGIAPSWATPAVWTTPGGEQLVVNGSEIRGYDAVSGAPLWTLGPTSVQVVASPVIGEDGIAYVSSGYPPARPIYAVRAGISGDVVVEPGAQVGGVLAWHRSRGGAYMPTPLLYRGLLYIVHHDGRVAVHDAGTGEIVGKKRLSEGGTCTGSPVVANGLIYQGTEEGQLYVMEVGPELRELAVVEFDAPLMATPAISEGIVIVRTPSELIALATETETQMGTGTE